MAVRMALLNLELRFAVMSECVPHQEIYMSLRVLLHVTRALSPVYESIT